MDVFYTISLTAPHAEDEMAAATGRAHRASGSIWKPASTLWRAQPGWSARPNAAAGIDNVQLQG